MKTKTITYTYDPDARSLMILVDGKPKGGFIGPEGERRFIALLDSDEQINITTMNAEAYKKILIRQFHAALAKQGNMSQKENILSGYGVESTLELTVDQLKEVVEQFSSGRQSKPETPATARIRNLRSDLLTICNKLGIYTTNTDWSMVNNFFLKHTGKLMYQMDEAELLKARKQFNSILDWSMKNEAEINRQKQQN